jgi:hypothetical protein
MSGSGEHDTHNVFNDRYTTLVKIGLGDGFVLRNSQMQRSRKLGGEWPGGHLDVPLHILISAPRVRRTP